LSSKTGSKFDVSLGVVVTRKVRLQGNTEESRVGMEAMLRAISQHAKKPVVDQTFAFGKLREALDYLALSMQSGKVYIQHYRCITSRYDKR